MKTRPWPIVFLALIQICTPLANIVLNSWLTHTPMGAFLSKFWHQASYREIFEFFCLMPIAGFAIFTVRKWSYPVFIAAVLWTAVSNFEAWQEAPKQVHLDLLFTIYFLNSVLVAYFLIPAVRFAYFNPQIRWWETKPRYVIDLPGMAHLSTGSAQERNKECMIHNVSIGGAFLNTSEDLELNCEFDLEFKVLTRTYHVRSKVVHVRNKGAIGYGIQFIHTPETEVLFKRLTYALQVMRLERRPEKTPITESFHEWFTTLFTTGKGWLPEIPKIHGEYTQKQKSPDHNKAA